jgi:hypothetical protein
LKRFFLRHSLSIGVVTRESLLNINGRTRVSAYGQSWRRSALPVYKHSETVLVEGKSYRMKDKIENYKQPPFTAGIGKVGFDGYFTHHMPWAF